MRPRLQVLVFAATVLGLGAMAVPRACIPPPPIPGLPIVYVDDAAPPFGVFDQADIDAALVACFPGCNLRFHGETYDDVAMTIGAFPNGFAMYGGRLERTVLRSPLFGPGEWQPLITVGSDAPDGVNEPGVIISWLTLDGRKSEQVPPLLPGTSQVDSSQVGLAIGILTGPPFGNVVREKGRIQYVRIEDFVSSAIVTWDSVDWMIEDSVMNGLGCNQADPAFSCGDLLVPNPWDDVDDLSPSIPGRKTVGFGVNMINGTIDTTVRNNRISNATKIGIEAFASSNTTCADAFVARGIVVEGNTVSNSHTGYVVNGGCEITFTDNLAEGMIVPGGTGNVGNGFVCGRGGDGSTWIGNRSERNQRAGYTLGCGDGNLVFIDNQSTDNCRINEGKGPQDFLAIDDVSFRGPSGVSPSPSGLWVENLTATGVGNCAHGLRIQLRADVTVSGGVVEGGRDRGLWIRGVSGMNVRDLTLTSSQPAGSGDTGVFFDFAQPLADVYVHASSLVTGFDDETESSIPPVLGDGVAYCLEEPEPGCDP